MKRSSKHLHSQAVRARKLTFWEKGHLHPHVICHMSYVICHMACVTCHMSHVMCHCCFVGGGSVINWAATLSSFNVFSQPREVCYNRVDSKTSWPILAGKFVDFFCLVTYWRLHTKKSSQLFIALPFCYIKDLSWNVETYMKYGPLSGHIVVKIQFL